MIDLPSPLELGLVLMLDDQAYELREIRPHRKADGTTTELLAWETACASCGETFEALSPVKLSNTLTRRCVNCRKPGKPVKGKRGRKLNVPVIRP
jgi:hypothetical protein